MEEQKDRRIRFLWSSNSVFCNSGYGTFQKDLLYRMIEDGWITAQSAFFGVEGYQITLDGKFVSERFKGKDLLIYPRMGEVWGTDAHFHHGRDFKADVHMFMGDVWHQSPQFLQQMKVWIPYAPVDKDPVPSNVLEKLKFAYKIISMSEFGQKALQKAGFTSTLIKEGTDVNIFKPADKMDARKKLGIPPQFNEAYIFGMIAANKENPPRKGFQEAIEAFALFYKTHPDAAMFFHSQQISNSGFPVMQFGQHLGVGHRMIFVNDYKAIYKSDSYAIAEEMNAIDCLLHPSQTEGFGLTVIEAMSCGKPAIVNNSTSQPEMIIKDVTGEVCEVASRRFTNDLSFVDVADVKSLADKMESVYKMSKEDPKLAENCRNHIVTNYNVDLIYEKQWRGLFEKLQKDLLKPVEKPATI